jgi:hypothetical protein
MATEKSRQGCPSKLGASWRYQGALKRAPTFADSISWLELSTVYCGMADVLALDDVDHVFGYVGCVITDALEILGH